jgi:hypothetical protein
VAPGRNCRPGPLRPPGSFPPVRQRLQPADPLPHLAPRLGPCYRFADPSGNPYALFQNDRPEAMERAYSDKDTANAIRG